MSTSLEDLSQPIAEPIAGQVFVLGWAVGITLWSVSHLAPNAETGAFIVDIGILALSVGIAAPFLKSRSGLNRPFRQVPAKY